MTDTRTVMVNELTDTIVNSCIRSKECIDVDVRQLTDAISMWIETALLNQRNTDYYRGLVVKIGEIIGDKAYIQDDGGIVDEVLCAKVPELVREMAIQNREFKKVRENVVEFLQD